MKHNAAFYDQFFGPLFFEPYAIEVAKRIEPGNIAVALEIAAGTGRVTRHIRERIPATARLIASDISSDMLAVAIKKLRHLSIEWQAIDAQQLPFGDNTIDLVICCFGYMFVTDKPTSFAEAYRVLKKGGGLLITTWDTLEKNPVSAIATAATKEYLEDSQPADINPATSMNDAAEIRLLLQHAGFSNISIEKVNQLSVSPSAKQAAAGLVEGSPFYAAIKKRHPASIDEIKKKVEKELAEQFGPAPMVAPISALISRAWK